MPEQETSDKRRKAGRPRTYEHARSPIHISLSNDLLAALDAATDNRTAYIERVLREHFEELNRVTSKRP